MVGVHVRYRKRGQIGRFSLCPIKFSGLRVLRAFVLLMFKIVKKVHDVFAAFV